jgi:site-specific DNA-methyltransferase (cytosine-N4-specific)
VSNWKYILNTFIKKFETILTIYKEFNSSERLDIIENAQLINSKDCSILLKDSLVDMILTSPPYINTYDYYLYHKHRMNWLGFDVKYSMNNEIGSRREFSSLKHNESEFNDDLYEIFEQCNKHLKKDGHAVIVIGDGKVAGNMYDAKENIIKLCEPLNWEMVDYYYTYLEKTSRSFQKFHSSLGKKEHIITFKKR